jgi:prepilin-type N-terminal cleavage/methylation domain-containing protein
MKSASLRPSHPRAGFTLVETLVAVTLIGLTMTGVLVFMHQGLKMYYLDRGRTMVNRDMRSFTSKLDTDAVTSNYFRIYPDFSTRTLDDGSDAAKADGEVGDFAVFVFTEPDSTSAGVDRITRLVGYYREITDADHNTGPVHRFDISTTTEDLPHGIDPRDYTSFAAILNHYVTGSASSYPIVTQLAQGLATSTTDEDATPALFYDWENRSVMINAQVSEYLSESNTGTQTGSTYNFTVSPRG